VSASLRAYLDEVARRLGVDALLCTELEVDDDGRCTGRMKGGNCRGPAKATRLRAYLGDREVTLWAYGDSAGDREMLALADHPTLV
jgi:phosphatidylglycerophosphatase C